MASRRTLRDGSSAALSPSSGGADFQADPTLTQRKSPARNEADRAFQPPKRSVLRERGEVHRRHFSAPIDFGLELVPVALVEVRHARALDGGDVNERIVLPIVALNEAEALHRVEELDRATGLFARKLALRTTGTAGARRIAVTRGTTILDRE